MSALLQVDEPRPLLWRCAGARRRLARDRRRRDRGHRRRQRRRQELADPRHPRHREAGARHGPFRRRRHHRLAVATASARRASAMSPRDGRSFPISRCWRTSRWAPRRSARARAEKQTLERVFALFPRLAERRRQAAGTLSGGEQQMLAIGRCLMGQPRLIMFDEPSLGLAPDHRAGGLPHRAPPERGGPDHPAGRAERHGLAQDRPSRLRAGERPHRAARHGRELLNNDRVRQAYLGLVTLGCRCHCPASGTAVARRGTGWSGLLIFSDDRRSSSEAA